MFYQTQGCQLGLVMGYPVSDWWTWLTGTPELGKRVAKIFIPSALRTTQWEVGRPWPQEVHWPGMAWWVHPGIHHKKITFLNCLALTTVGKHWTKRVLVQKGTQVIFEFENWCLCSNITIPLYWFTTLRSAATFSVLYFLTWKEHSGITKTRTVSGTGMSEWCAIRTP